MNREIKFRAWDKKNKKMLTVAAFYPNTQQIEDNSRNEFDKQEYTLQQFTGLLDKNGKEIWEGDILKCFDRKPFLMKIKSAGGCGCCDSEIAFGWWFDDCLPENCEVIGNIFEQSHLLNNKEED